MNKIRVKSQTEDVVFDLPVEISAVDGAPPPDNFEQLRKEYSDRTLRYLKTRTEDGIAQFSRNDLDKEQLAILLIGEYFDTPYVFHRLGDDHAYGRARDYAGIILENAEPWFARTGRGLPGWRCYARGAIEIEHVGIANQIVFKSAYSSVIHQKPSNPYWPLYRGEGTPAQTRPREFSLSTIAHLEWMLAFGASTGQERYVDDVRDHILVPLTRWYIAQATDRTDEYLQDELRNVWYPFYITHLLRGLIMLHEHDRLDADVVTPLVEQLSDLMWVKAYREDAAGKHGLCYQLYQEHPAPDLSLWTMPVYAWLSQFDDPAARQRALSLLESGTKWAWWDGQKQFCQSQLWTHLGLQWLSV